MRPTSLSLNLLFDLSIMHSDSPSTPSPSLALEPPNSNSTPASNETPVDPNYINNLPAELLGRIFDLHVRIPIWRADGIVPANLKALLVLTAVCGQWRDVAVSMPDLWNRSDLSGRIHPGLVELSLNRAKESVQFRFRATHRDKYTVDTLPMVTSRLDRWRNLDLELGPTEELYGYNTDSGTGGDGHDWLPPIGENKASNLTHFQFKVCGSHDEETVSKINWGMDMMQYAPKLRDIRLYLPALVGNGHCIPWQQLRHISLHVEAGVDVDNILAILSETPRIIHFDANLTSYSPEDTPPVLSGQGYQTKLYLPNMKSLNLSGMFVLETLRDLYSYIVFAPLLDNLRLTCPQPNWDHESCLRLLDNAPAQITDLELEVTFIPEAMLLAYLQHPKVEPTLESLTLYGSPNIEATLSESFHRFLTFSTDSQARDYRPLCQLNSIDLQHCLRTTNGLLADMVESRIRRGDGDRKTLYLTIKTSPDNPVDGYEVDRDRLRAFKHKEKYFQDLYWFVEKKLEVDT